jgi:hypothetical protein
MARKRRRDSQGKQALLPVMRADAAGIDIGATEIFVAVPPDRATENVRSFPTFTQDLYALAEWLKQCGIKTVAIAYASHCTSLGRCETLSIDGSLFDNLTPLAFLGGSDPGSS